MWINLDELLGLPKVTVVNYREIDGALFLTGQWEVLEACKWRKENRTSDTKECRYVRNWLI